MRKLDLLKKKISLDKKPIFTLIGGTAAGQAVSFLLAPITTRLFSPEVFGDLSVFTSITGIIGIVICLRYELTIVVPKDDSEGFNLFKLCLFFTTVISILIGLLFFVFKVEIYATFNAFRLAKYWYFVPLTLFFTGIVQASNYWLIRKNNFKIISFNKLVPSLIVNLLSIFLGLIGYKEVGSRLFSILMSLIVNVLIVIKVIYPEFHMSYKFEKETCFGLVKKYKDAAVYDVLGSMINNMAWMIVPILLNYFYSSNAAGQYSVGLRVIQVPANIIGISISSVFIKRASDLRRTGGLYDYCINICKKLLIVTLPICLVFLFFGKQIFELVFGSEWQVAGIYMQILSPWALAWFCISPLFGIFTLMSKQKVFLIFSILNLSTRYLSLRLGNYQGSDVKGLIYFSISGALIYCICLGIVLHLSLKSDRAIAQSKSIHE